MAVPSVLRFGFLSAVFGLMAAAQAPSEPAAPPPPPVPQVLQNYKPITSDRLTKPEAGIRISEMVPGADFTKIDPAGHIGLLEEGERYGDAIAQLVQRAVNRPRVNPSPVAR